MRSRESNPRYTGDPLADVASLLTRLGIRHVFSGSYALGAYGTPRGTQDVDVIVHTTAAQMKKLAVEANAEGLLKDPASFLRAVAKGDIGYLHTPLRNGTRFKVEIIPAGGHFPLRLDKAILRRSRMQPHRLRPLGVRMISPDDLVVAKLFFFRDKDRTDIENLIRAGSVNPRAVIARLREYVDPRDEHLGEREAWFRTAMVRIKRRPR